MQKKYNRIKKIKSENYKKEKRFLKKKKKKKRRKKEKLQRTAKAQHRGPMQRFITAIKSVTAYKQNQNQNSPTKIKYSS